MKSVAAPFSIANGGSLTFVTQQYGWLKWTSGGVAAVDPSVATVTGADNIRGTLDRVEGYAGLGPGGQVGQVLMQRGAAAAS